MAEGSYPEKALRLNLRDHGTTHHLNRELFHSCRLPEVVGAIQALARRFERIHETNLWGADTSVSGVGTGVSRDRAVTRGARKPTERITSR